MLNSETSRRREVQPMLPLPRALQPVWRDQNWFQRGTSSRPYRLPRAVQDRLTSSLAGFRNRSAAMALASFLGRFWSVPGRVALPFPIDRRALAGREDLQLSEAQVRGAIKTLETVGFLDRVRILGSQYKPTAEGLHRKPVPFVFGPDYAPLFIAANRRAGEARGGVSGAHRSQGPDKARGPSVVSVGARQNHAPWGAEFPAGLISDGAVTDLPSLNSPKSKSEANPFVIMGEQEKGCRGQVSFPQRPEPDSGLESALERWRLAFEASRR